MTDGLTPKQTLGSVREFAATAATEVDQGRTMTNMCKTQASAVTPLTHTKQICRQGFCWDTSANRAQRRVPLTGEGRL